MSLKDFVIGVVAFVALGLGFYALTHSTPPTPPTLSGAGQTLSFHQIFQDGFTLGGFDFATSSQGAATYTAASFVKAQLIEHNATAALTATLPTNAALSSAGFLPTPGDTEIRFIHASTTAITIAGNTGVNLLAASTTKQVPAGVTGMLTCTRHGATEARLITCTLVAD